MSLDHDRVADVVREQHARQPFSGVVQVRHCGRPLYTGAFGSANRAADVANTTRTRFGTASGTKTFTAVAVCQLIEAGSLSPDTRLHEAVDVGLPGFDPDITIHHLLTHTSGGPDSSMRTSSTPRPTSPRPSATSRSIGCGRRPISCRRSPRSP